MSVSVVTSAFCSCVHAAHLPRLPLTPLLQINPFVSLHAFLRLPRRVVTPSGTFILKTPFVFYGFDNLSQSVHLLCLASWVPFISLLSSSERQKEKEVRQSVFQWSQISDSYNMSSITTITASESRTDQYYVLLPFPYSQRWWSFWKGFF